MEVNIGTKVQRKIDKKPFQPKTSTKKIGKSDFQTKNKKTKPRVIPFPLEEMIQINRDVIDWASPGKPFASKKKDKRPLVHLFISIAGALLVGTVMGFSVLTLSFSDHPNANSNTIDAHLPDPTVKTPTATKPIQQKPATVPTSINLPSLHVALLQAGNYQSKSSATRIAEQYRTKGFAAVMSDQAPYRIYLGIAASKKEAQQLTKRYAAKGITVYVKEQSLTGKSTKINDLLTTLKVGNQLFKQLQAISVANITNAGDFRMPADLKSKQQAFMKANQKSTAYPPEVRSAMMELARGLDQAVQGADELSKHPNATLAWFIQEGLVRYATGYEHLIYALSQKR